MRDLSNKEDVKTIVDIQYGNLLKDPETAPVFQHLTIEDHLPTIYKFWCFVLDIEAAENRYTGSAFEPHTKLKLEEKHFEIWLSYLHNAINQHFEGENAQKWIEKSNQLGLMFQYKLGIKDFKIEVKNPPQKSNEQ